MSFAGYLVLALAGSGFACCVWILWDLIQAQDRKIDYLSDRVRCLEGRFIHLEEPCSSGSE